MKSLAIVLVAGLSAAVTAAFAASTISVTNTTSCYCPAGSQVCHSGPAQTAYIYDVTRLGAQPAATIKSGASKSGISVITSGTWNGTICSEKNPCVLSSFVPSLGNMTDNNYPITPGQYYLVTVYNPADPAQMAPSLHATLPATC